MNTQGRGNFLLLKYWRKLTNICLLFPQTRQNVVDVNHHVTQYQQLIAELQYQVIRLRAELDKATECTAESSEVRGLCDELRSLTQDQREIR